MKITLIRSFGTLMKQPVFRVKRMLNSFLTQHAMSEIVVRRAIGGQKQVPLAAGVCSQKGSKMKRWMVGVVAGAVLLVGGGADGAVYTVTGETLVLGPAAHNAVFNLGGADIQAGSLVFDYAGASDPAATITSLLSASCDGGRWDIGQFRDSTASATGLTLGWRDDTSSHQLKVMATYAGDFNLDGVVDDLDRNIWFANAFTGTTWQQGDANYDGVIDGLDRDLWSANFGSSPLENAEVPEPATLIIWSLLGAGSWLGMRVAQRGRRVGRQPSSFENREAIHEIVSRGMPR
jgi:hypothetical protein